MTPGPEKPGRCGPEAALILGNGKHYGVRRGGVAHFRTRLPHTDGVVGPQPRTPQLQYIPHFICTGYLQIFRHCKIAELYLVRKIFHDDDSLGNGDSHSLGTFLFDRGCSRTTAGDTRNGPEQNLKLSTLIMALDNGRWDILFFCGHQRHAGCWRFNVCTLVLNEL